MNMMRYCVVFFGFFWLIATGTLCAGPLLKVEPSTDGKNARIQVFPSETKGFGLLELVEAGSSNCVRTLHAGTFSSGQIFSLGANHGLKDGAYRVRYREGVTLAVDTVVKLSHNEKWINPTDVAISKKGVYVFDRGIPGTPAAKKEDGTMTDEVPGKGSTYLHRFLRDGKPDTTFADRGRATLLDDPWTIVSMAVDDEGWIYFPSGGHDVRVFGSYGETTTQTIGGWDGDPLGPKGTGWVFSLALGPARKIYIYTGYGIMRVYDRSKNGFEGNLYSSPIATQGVGRPMTSDREGSIYRTTATHLLQKIEDTGKALKETYTSKESDKMYVPMGPSASAGLIWVVDHGPCGPFWDSGGDNDLLLFWDNGSELVFIERFGAPGKAADKLEFLNPCAVAQTPDLMVLWIAKDRMPKPDGPPGNTRVRKFRINAAQTEEVPLDLKGK